MEKWKTVVFGIVIVSCYAMAGLWLYRVSGLYIHKAILWNLFLAWIPFGLSIWYVKLENIRHRNFSWLVLLLWLLVFPNAPYMMTDVIHISPITFYEYISSGSIYVQDIYAWLQLLYLTMGILCGFLLGLKSLDLILSVLRKRYGVKLTFFLLVCISLFSGYGVFLGRFLRLNSWDILNPFTLIGHVIEETNLFAIQFSLGFALFILLCYGVYHISHKSHDNR